MRYKLKKFTLFLVGSECKKTETKSIEAKNRKQKNRYVRPEAKKKAQKKEL